MKTKKLTPRNAAPVQREINTTASVDGTGEGGSTGLIPLGFSLWGLETIPGGRLYPFAGDDAE